MKLDSTFQKAPIKMDKIKEINICVANEIKYTTLIMNYIKNVSCLFTSSTSPLKLSLYHFFPFCRTLYTSFSVHMRAATVYSIHTCNGHFSASNVVYCRVTQLTYQRWSRNSHHIARMDQYHFNQVTPPYTTYDAYDVTQ